MVRTRGITSRPPQWWLDALDLARSERAAESVRSLGAGYATFLRHGQEPTKAQIAAAAKRLERFLDGRNRTVEVARWLATYYGLPFYEYTPSDLIEARAFHSTSRLAADMRAQLEAAQRPQAPPPTPAPAAATPRRTGRSARPSPR